MKKHIFLLLALTAALLLALGMSTATATTADDGHEHWAWCDNPTVCAECGAAYDGPARHGVYGWDDYQADATEHWLYCERCGIELDRGTHEYGDWQYNETEHWQACQCGVRQLIRNHFAACDNPTICAECGQPYSGDDIRHDWSDWQYTETECWQVCNKCSEERWRSEHAAWCNQPGVCLWCGTSYSGSNVEHDWGEYQYTETEHWVYCNRCGEELDRGEHGAWCGNRGVCAWCGISYSGDNITHDWSDWQSDGSYHWKECTLCSTVADKAVHYVSCDNQNNQCYVCGAVCENPIVRHDWDGYTHDDLYHWYECLNCGKVIGREPHYAYCDTPGVCAACGYEKAGIPIYHDQDTSNFTIDQNNHTSKCLRCGLKYVEQHYVSCTNPGVCKICGAAVSGATVHHTYSDYKSDADYHWYTCTDCGLEQKEEHSRVCTGDNTCYFCGQPYSGSNVSHYYDETVGYQYQHDETNHWYLCSECGEKYDVEAHIYGDDGVCTVCSYSKPAVTDAPTTAPTDAPTTAPTEKPTEQPETPPTDTPHEHTWTVTAETAATCEKGGSVTYSCACGETKTETVKPLGHDFQVYVSRGDGTHRSDCERCGVFTVKNCVMNSQTVNGIPCSTCGICGYTTVPELTGIALPEEAMTNVSAVTAEGAAVPVRVLDLTPSLPENTVMALCLRIVPEDGAALPGSVRVSVPCTLDTANMRLVFIPDGELPVDTPFETADGQLIFTVTAPGIFALVPVQE